ncbi:hypothetical protein diail_1534 [Diaporthe ilicicola]|nr:hypothetical protein diail_1534 [Diaporthe ilicicola]
MSDDSTPAGKTDFLSKRTRRTHRKSRHGCKNCKLRRIKCDETKPTCENCVKFRVPCGFDSNPSSPPKAPLPAQDQPRGRGRPRKDWLAAAAQSPPNDSSPGGSTGLATTSPDTPSEQPPPYLVRDHSLNIADLQLLHHYMYKASINVAKSKGPDQFWSIDVPQMGFANPHTLHLVLTYSALHMSRHEADAERQQQLHDEAVLHFATALQQTRLELSRLCRANAHALYVSSMLVCFCTFAKGPSPGDFLMFTSAGGGEPATWLQLVRGVRIIIETIGSPFMFDETGPLRAMFASGPDRWSQDRGEERRERERQHRPDWRGPVDRLRLHICSLLRPSDFGRREDVCRLSLRALEAICEPCEAMWGKTPDDPLERDKESSVFAWLYRLDDDYIRCLERKEQLALVVYAYFALVLKELEVFWFMEGWAEHIILGVDQLLDEGHRKWLEWPKEQLGLLKITIKKYTESMVLR